MATAVKGVTNTEFFIWDHSSITNEKDTEYKLEKNKGKSHCWQKFITNT